MKHIDLKYHFLKEEIANGVFDLRPVKSILNIADIFTKALPGPRFQELRTLLNVKRVPEHSSDLSNHWVFVLVRYYRNFRLSPTVPRSFITMTCVSESGF